MTRSNQTSNNSVAIRCQDVCYQIHGAHIFKDLSFDLMSHRIGIVGRNGSGKSTLARLMAGIIAPTSGKILINGHDLSQDRKAALRHIGFIFQNPDHQIIFPTVTEEITFGLRQLGQTKDDAEQHTARVLQAFGKPHWQNANIASLSQGQKHLVCLMAITAMNPKCLILDEPFTGLDIPTKRQLSRYFQNFNGSLIHISHDPNDLDQYDQIIWIEDKEIHQIATAQNILPRYEIQMNALGETDDISDISN